MTPSPSVGALQNLQARVVRCRRCPRLVAYRERVAEDRVRRFSAEAYWGKPLPGFGDPAAQVLIVGLAPAAHGGNRTGRMFTGDRSGDFLFRALHGAGFASQPDSLRRDDGLQLWNCYITAAVRCAPPANKPTPVEFAACRPYLVDEIRLLARLRAVVALGAIAFRAFLTAWAEAGRSTPHGTLRFSHGLQVDLSGGVLLLASYHPSQRNTQTGLLTPAMLAQVFAQARQALVVPEQTP